MTLHRYDAKRDIPEKEIVAALLKAGCTVRKINAAGIPDLLVGLANRNYLLEVKQPGKNLTVAQHHLHMRWRGQIAIVHTPEEALRVVGL